MPTRDWTARVADILQAIERIRSYVSPLNFDEFASDTKSVDAVIRNVAVIGEAARAVPADMQSAHPDIPWRIMGDMRNVVVHAYFQVDLNILWQTVQDDLPPLIEPLQEMLSES